jgi:hypothetical protein
MKSNISGCSVEEGGVRVDAGWGAAQAGGGGDEGVWVVGEGEGTDLKRAASGWLSLFDLLSAVILGLRVSALQQF